MEKSLEALSERANLAEKMADFLQKRYSETVTESRKRKLEERVREVDKRGRGLKERLVNIRDLAFLEEELDSERVSLKLREIEDEEERLRLERESLAEKKKKIDLVIDTLSGRIAAVEEKEEKFNLFVERKEREMALREDRLKELAEEVKLAGEKFRQHEFVERMELAESKLDAMRVKMDERFKEIEFRGNAGWGSLESTIKEAGLIRELVETKSEELEMRKQEFCSLQEEKTRELASKEKLLDDMSEHLVKDAELRNEQLMEQEKLGHQLLERLQLAKDNVEGLMRSAEERMKEIGIKTRELASKEELLNVMSSELVEDAKLRNKQLIELENSGYRLLKKLDLAKDDVERLKIRVRKRYMKLCSKETELDSLSDWIERKMDKTDQKEQGLKEQEQRMTKIEDHLISKENELQEKEMSLRAWQKELEDKEDDIDSAQKSNEQRLEKLNAREKSLKEFIRNCFTEHLSIKRELKIEKDLVDKTSRDLVLREQYLRHSMKELEFREKQMREMDHVKAIEFQHQQWNNISNSPLGIESNESVDLKFVVRMDGKTLQMFLNDSEKDLESMGDEIFKVLHLSTDPAKLVLDAMEGFYPPHLRKEDVDLNVKRTCITLLQQLSKMSPNITIKPHVRKEAIELATSWKSNIRATDKNPDSIEVFGFLSLVSAYQLTSDFDKDEIYSLLMMLDKQVKIPELHQVLGSANSL